MNSVQRQEILIAFLLVLALGITVGVFWLALTGPFFFDDLAVLSWLGESDNGITTLGSLIDFISSYSTRPLSMLSFVLNDQAWPTDPWSFKYTNLFLHLLNGVLVFILSRQLARLLGLEERRGDWLALLTMTFWLLHPMQMATIMVTVQRMTQIMTLFVLLGLICYLHGRLRVATQLRAGYLWMSVGVGLFGILAILGKENGLLLPLYILVIEFTLARKADLPLPRHWQKWSAVFLWLPLLLLLLMVTVVYSLQAPYALRDFSMTERLLTEPRVIVEYLRKILLPRPSGYGVFNDDITVSEGLLDPVTTLLSLLFLGALGLSAILLRRRFSVFSFAILWYFAAHLLESTFIGLELYYEHRNYLATVGLFFGLAYALISAPLAARLVQALTAIIILMFSVVSYQASIIWGDDFWLSLYSTNNHPRSVRAQEFAAIFWQQQGQYVQALEHIGTAIEHNPQNVGLYCQAIILKLQSNTLDSTSFATLTQVAKTGSFNFSALECLRQLRVAYEQKLFPQLSAEALTYYSNALLENPRYAFRYSYIYTQKGLLAAGQGDLNTAMTHLDSAYQIKADIDVLLLQAELLVSAGLYSEAKPYMTQAEQLMAAADWPLSMKYSSGSGYQQRAAQLEKNIALYLK